jgi:hypothetical protein
MFLPWLGKLADMTAVQSPHDADPGQHRGAAGLRKGLAPPWRPAIRARVLSPRQFHDEGGRILQGEEQAAIRKRYWVLKRGRPGQ